MTAPLRLLLYVFVYMMIVGLALLGGAIVYLQYWKYEDPYKVLHPQAHYATQMSRTTVALGRKFVVTRPVNLTVSREIVQRGSADVRDLFEGSLPGYKYNFRLELDESTIPYEPGVYDNNRIITIPVVPPGLYQVRTRVCWAENILRRKCIQHPEIPELEVEIKE